MENLNKNKVGLSLGLLSVFLHLLWMITVYIKSVETLLSWFKSYHFISPTYTILKFDFKIAFLGLISAFLISYIIGWLFAFIYNKLNQGKNEKN